METGWAVTPKKIETVVQKIVSLQRPRKVIVFGSAARGQTDRNSDVDILVVIGEQMTSPRKESVRIRRALRGISMPMDILVISEERFRQLAEQSGLVYREAVKHGRVMYEAAH